LLALTEGGRVEVSAAAAGVLTPLQPAPSALPLDDLRKVAGATAYLDALQGFTRGDSWFSPVVREGAYELALDLDPASPLGVAIQAGQITLVAR
jgi:hypothetical protein